LFIVSDKKESKDDLINTKFKVSVKMINTDFERELLERDIEIWTKTPDAFGNPLISPADAYTIRGLDNVKTAQEYLAAKVDENRTRALAEKRKDAEDNIKSQQDSNAQAADKAIKLQKDKLAFDERIKELEGRNKKEEILLTEGLKIWNTLLAPQKASGEGGISSPMQKPQMPQQLEALLNMTFESVAQSLTIEMNKSEEQVQAEQMEKEQMMQAAAEQQAMQGQQQQM
jgi:hypothetical protein